MVKVLTGVLGLLLLLALIPPYLGAVLMLGMIAAGPYLYGCKVGLREGRKRGRAAADAEWANMMEHGAVPEPALPRDAGMFSPSELERWQ